MSYSKNANKLIEKSGLDTQIPDGNEDKGEINCETSESCTYAVTVSKKSATTGEEASILCAGQKSFISIHSTDQLCQLPEIENPVDLDQCNVEVLSLNEVFPSTSEESFSNDEESPIRRKRHNKKGTQKLHNDTTRSSYMPTNSKSSTVSGRHKDVMVSQAPVHSDFNIPKNTLHVMGSNPGEPKMSYPDPVKKMSKTINGQSLQTKATC